MKFIFMKKMVMKYGTGFNRFDAFIENSTKDMRDNLPY